MGKLLPSLLLLALVGGGCMTPARVAALKRRVELLDLNTFETLKFKAPGPYQEHLLLSPFQAQEVCYLFRHRNELKLVFRSLDGATTEAETAPLYSLWYILEPALRPDETAIAYFADGTTAVHVYEFATKKKIRITGDLAPDHAHIQALRWIDNRYLLVALADQLKSAPDSQGRPVVKRATKGSLVKVDSETQRILTALELEQPSDVAVSPSGTYAAVTQMIRGTGIKIVDLRSLSVTTEIPGNNSRSWMHTPAWCSDESKLAYADGEDWLCVFSMKDGSTKRVLPMPPGQQVSHFLGFPREDLLVWRTGKLGSGSSSPDPMYFIDLRSGTVTKTIKRHFNGKAEVIANGQAIASEVGY